MKTQQAGFTMVELVVVISIMGMLAAVIAPSFSQFLETSRLKYSQQLVETGLGKAFSSARSHPEGVIVRGWTEGRFLEILPDEGINTPITPCTQESLSCQKLDQGISFEEDFQITFIPPYGDIEETGTETEIQLNSSNYSTKIRIHHASGLIEPLRPESE